MFPGPGAQIYRNEAGEPIGWDYPPDPRDPGNIDDHFEDDFDDGWDDFEEEDEEDGD